MKEIILTSSALILFLIIIRRLLRGRISPTLQYALWLLVAARLLIPGSLFTAPVSVMGAAEQLQSAVEANLSAEDSPLNGSAAVPAIPYNAQPEMNQDLDGNAVTYYSPDAITETAVRQTNYLSAVWKLGILLVGCIFILSNLKFYVNLRKKRMLLPEEELPHPCKTRVYLVEDLPSLCLFGLFRPSIYVNRIALEPGRLEHILVHEETHYRHGDHLWSLLRCLCLAIHWYNPLVWWAASLSRRDCELSCDSGAIRRLGEEMRLDYGQTLLAMVSPGPSPAGLLRTATTMNGGKRTMAERISLIAKRPRMLKITLLAVLLVVGCASAAVFAGAAETPQQEDIPPAAEDSATTAPLPNPAPGISEEESLVLYGKAREAWDWFELGSLPVIDDYYENAEGRFLRVDGFDTLEELRGYLLTLFSPELADHLLTDYQLFHEIGGTLFVQPAGRDSSIYAGAETVQAFVMDNAAQQGYDCHLYAATEVLDLYDPSTVLYQKRHDWFISWNGENYVFTSFGPWDDVDPQRYYNALTILDHYQRGNTITTWLPMLWDLDWNALYATRGQWPEGFDLGLYVIDSLSQYITEQGSEMTGVQYRDILSATEGLDGAYAEGFQVIVFRLYDMDPSLFADTVLNGLSTRQQAQVIDYLRWELAYRETGSEVIPWEEIWEQLKKDLGGLVVSTGPQISAAPQEMVFDQSGQSGQFLAENVPGIYACTYTSSDSAVARVDENGTVTAVSPGETTISLHLEYSDGQRDFTCRVTCAWEVAEDAQMSDGEVMNGIMRGSAPTATNYGSPESLVLSLTGDWSTEGIRSALWDALADYVRGTYLEGKLTDVTISYRFQFPNELRDGITLEVPYTAAYTGDPALLPSGETFTPSVRTGELTATVHLVGEGVAAPVDEDFAAGQAEYQKLAQCAKIETGFEVSAEAESFDIMEHLQAAVEANLEAAGLSERYQATSFTLGSYYNPVWMDPGSVQIISYTVTFTPQTGDGIQATISGEITVTTTE